MDKMSEDQFKTLFQRATDVGEPYKYQQDLATVGDTVPRLLDVPTGLGKTAAAILAWVWRRRFAGASIRNQTPRRLVYCLPMRVLVEQTFELTIEWLRRLDLFTGENKEQHSEWSRPEGDFGDYPIAVHLLMGGEERTDWALWPERDAILIGTQDMLLSRALNRGYAAYPARWPVEFGLLNTDTLWVMDEVQLMGSGRTTGAQLQLFSADAMNPEPLGHRQTLWMSATLGVSADDGNTTQVEAPQWLRTPEWDNLRGNDKLPIGRFGEADLLQSQDARNRWNAPKTIELHIQPPLPEEMKAKTRRIKKRIGDNQTPTIFPGVWTATTEELSEAVVSELRARERRLVLVFFNQVQRTGVFFAAIKAKIDTDVSAGQPDVILLHSRFRPRDRKGIVSKLLSEVPPAGRLIISTQVLEAGVDLDSDVLFTEVCPWPSLIQRLGRLNRRGEKPNAKAVVLEPVPVPSPQQPNEKPVDYRARVERELVEQSRPYQPGELEETRGLLRRIAEEHKGNVSPATLAQFQPSVPIAGPVIRSFDVDDLFDTDPDLSGGHIDVSLWVRALDRDVDAYLMWRHITDGTSLTQQPPPHRDELCAVPFYQARDTLKKKQMWLLTLVPGRKRRSAAWRPIQGSDIRPGDTVLLDIGQSSVGFYSESAGWLPVGTATSHSAVPAEYIDRWPLNDGTWVRAWVRRDDNGNRHLVEVIDDRVSTVSSRYRDPRSFTRRWTSLNEHLQACVDEAHNLAHALLPTQFCGAVKQAAAWHDLGKALERCDSEGTRRRPFQDMLRRAGRLENGHPANGVLYAKSNGSGGDMGDDAFRHEVASALAYLQQSQPDDLVAYLILSHHGKVRLLPVPWDDESAADANGVRKGDAIPQEAFHGIDIKAQAVELDPGLFLPSAAAQGWQGRIVGLLEKFGPFGLAYLEAVLRIADWRVSR